VVLSELETVDHPVLRHLVHSDPTDHSHLLVVHSDHPQHSADLEGAPKTGDAVWLGQTLEFLL